MILNNFKNMFAYDMCNNLSQTLTWNSEYYTTSNGGHSGSSSIYPSQYFSTAKKSCRMVSTGEDNNPGTYMVFGNSTQSPTVSDYSLINTLENNITVNNVSIIRSSGKYIITSTITATSEININEIGVAFGGNQYFYPILYARSVIPTVQMSAGDTRTFTYTIGF